MTRLITFLFRAVLTVAGLIIVLKVFWPTPLEFLEWKWGTETRLTPQKPFEEVVQKRFADAAGRNFERQLAGVDKRLANNGDRSALVILTQAREGYQNDLRVIHGETSTQPTTPTQPITANIEDLRVEDLGNDEYDVQLDGRQEWPTVLEVGGPAKLWIQADPESIVCPGQPDPCAGPNGQTGLAKLSRFQPEQFPVGEAMFQALVGRLDDGPGFQIGISKEIDVPEGTHRFKAMDNIRIPFLHEVSGGHRFGVKVVRK